MEQRITDNLDQLKLVLPKHIRDDLDILGNADNLLEIVIDLGRLPAARYLEGEIALSDREVTRADLELITQQIGMFDADNRAGLERTLHRISAIRNRRGEVVGLTCRVGRAVYGTIDIIEELIKSGQNLLMLGPPGVGKTTMLREAARVLSQSKRVVIVDTSNEIGGDGDVPHPAVGKARRMQVSHPERQHEVMIEAVENHNPEVIVIDEIGRELEAMAARTIAERGVQLIGTAHGNTLENLLLNPTLSDLVGGIESVTLSDEEARRRGTQKSVLERRSPPTFEVLVEIQTRHRLAVHESVIVSVDALLRGHAVTVEMRSRATNGQITRNVQTLEAESRMIRVNANGQAPRPSVKMVRGPKTGAPPRELDLDDDDMGYDGDDNVLQMPINPINMAARGQLNEIKVYAYGVARNRLIQAARRLNVPLTVVDEFSQADSVITLKSYYRRRPKLIHDAERRNLAIYVLRANTVAQIENFLADVYKLADRAPDDPFAVAMLEAEEAIMRIQAGEKVVELAPQAAFIRKQQHKLIREAQLYSESYGEEGQRRVRIARTGS